MHAWSLKGLRPVAASQLCHAFAEPDGYGRTREEHDSEQFEIDEDAGGTGGTGRHDVRRARDREAPGSNQLVLVGVGTGLARATAASSALVEIPSERGGVGSALMQAFQKLGAPVRCGDPGQCAQRHLSGSPPTPRPARRGRRSDSVEPLRRAGRRAAQCTRCPLSGWCARHSWTGWMRPSSCAQASRPRAC
jgi:hypothetical protein